MNGRPRTFQTDEVVGHFDSKAHPSHFIAQNLAGHYYVLEIPGGDPTKGVRVIMPATATVQGGDLIPVTLQFKDIRHDGQPDLIVFAGDNRYVFINEHGAFRPLKPVEFVSI